MVRMNKIIGSSKDLVKQDEAALTKPPAPSSGLVGASVPPPSKPPEASGLLIPGRPNETEPLVETGLELPSTAPSSTASIEPGSSGDSLFYRVICQYVHSFMTDVTALNINTLVNYSHQIINRLQTGGGLLRLAMRPTYIEPFLGAHPVNVAILTALLAEVLRYDETHKLRAVVAALVHDIGMTRLPFEVIEHNRSLTPDEKDQLRQHPNYGAEIILEALGPDYEWLALAVRQEHERIQGQGYPQGLRGEQIDFSAQLLGILDVYESVTHPRWQRTAQCPSKSVKQLLESRNQYFTQQMLKALVEALSVFPIGTTVQLNTGEIGQVTSTNRKYPMRPVVEVQMDANHRPLLQPKHIDLKEHPVLSVKAIDPVEMPA